MGASAVNTYVVAIEGEVDAGADASSGPAYFDPVAAAGGTVRAYNGRSADEMLSSLKAIREHAAAACK
jgi:hypothetical protein